MSKRTDALFEEMRRELVYDAFRLVEEAYRTKTFEEQTGNLADSYGAAVYYNGVIVKDGIQYLEPKATEPRMWKSGDYRSGHDEMIKYFRNYKPRKQGFTIVLVAAMPYAPVLEGGNGLGLRHKYKVITGANSLMRELAAKYERKFGGRSWSIGKGTRTTINSIGV